MNQTQLKLIRNAYDMTQEEFANKHGIAYSSYFMHENGWRTSERINKQLNEAIPNEIKIKAQELINAINSEKEAL